MEDIDGVEGVLIGMISVEKSVDGCSLFLGGLRDTDFAPTIDFLSKRINDSRPSYFYKKPQRWGVLHRHGLF